MTAERLIEGVKNGGPEFEDEKESSVVYIGFSRDLYCPQPIQNALFRLCLTGTSLRSVITSGDYVNEDDPLRAMVEHGNMTCNVLTRKGWLKEGKDNIGAFIDYLRDTCALYFLVDVCNMKSSQFRDLELTCEEYQDMGITLDDVRHFFGKKVEHSERKRLGPDVNSIQSTKQEKSSENFLSFDELNSDSEDFFLSLVHKASEIKE